MDFGYVSGKQTREGIPQNELSHQICADIGGSMPRQAGLRKNTMKLFFTMFLILLSGCATIQKASDDSFYESLLLSNIKNTPYTAHVKIITTEILKVINSDSGQPGYIVFKVYADVIEIFKGESSDRVIYSVTHEAPSKDPPVGKEFIVSLKRSEKGTYYIPDNGYALPFTEKLRGLARSKGDAHKHG